MGCSGGTDSIRWPIYCLRGPKSRSVDDAHFIHRGRDGISVICANQLQNPALPRRVHHFLCFVQRTKLLATMHAPRRTCVVSDNSLRRPQNGDLLIVRCARRLGSTDVQVLQSELMWEPRFLE